MSPRKHRFAPVEPKVEFPKLEERVLRHWKENKTFERTLEKGAPRGSWTFLDGPPFITGLPHYGSLLSSIPKDLFPRFKTMQGYRVRRVWGWDCHGLPAENKVEERLGIKRKRDIEENIGVGRFIAECKKYVSQVSNEWEWYVDHIGRWVDFKNAYKTMDLPYMETVMWVFKQLNDKGLIYKGLRVSLFCPHCSTPISNFEVAMDPTNYVEITEPATVYKYQVKGEPSTYFLAWSTTPWNKIATPALAVNPKLTYIKVRQKDEYFILAKGTRRVLKGAYEVAEEFKGEDLTDREFVPHYDFYPIEHGMRAFVVIPGDFVTEEEGTGIVTIAAYGEEDLEAMGKNNIQIVLHVDEEGKLTPDVPKWAGMHYLEVNELVNEDLRKRGLIYREDQYIHTVPNCWRCGTRLFYAPQNAWYVNVQELKKRMEETNELINWFPSHFKYGRFLKSLQAAPDWCISRSRYWGSPVPVWECECGERYVPGSLAELEELSGQKIKDLHKPGIDKVAIKCKKCGKEARRVAEVLDSWIEAGSASFAERHYPFEKGQELEKFFPPDFIVEYTGQIRAWFYVVHVIANALYEKQGFKNVLVTGVILGDDGRKMSKNYGNYPDPKEMLENYGGDALRLYLMGSPVMKGEDILISKDAYAFQVRGFLKILWNVYNFFVSYANNSDWQPSKGNFQPRHVLDKWILSNVYGNIENLKSALEKFNTPEAVGQLWNFVVSDLSPWYVRRSRDRVSLWATDTDDKRQALQTLWLVLTEYSKAMAPIIPFISEEIYKNLTGDESVHLENWPKVRKDLRDIDLESKMALIRQVVSMGHAARKEATIPVRQPLAKVLVVHSNKAPQEELVQLIKEELNVKDVVWKMKKAVLEPQVKLDTKLTQQLLEEGRARKLARKVQEERKRLGTPLDAKVEVVSPWVPKDKEILDWLKQRTLAREIRKGKAFEVKQLA